MHSFPPQILRRYHSTIYPAADWRLLETGLADGATNMAIDETILWAVAEGELLTLCSQRTLVRDRWTRVQWEQMNSLTPQILYR